MKMLRRLLSAVVVYLAPVLPANAQETPAKWGPGCNKALLEGEFSMANAPKMQCSTEKKAYIDKTISEITADIGAAYAMKRGSPDEKMLSPEFTAQYLRAFANPGQDFRRYSGQIEGLLNCLNDRAFAAMIKDAWLDWDMWRAWLLFENTAYTLNYWTYSPKGTQTKIKQNLPCARQLLWTYLSFHSAAILKDPQRRAWWLTRLTADLEAPGGRPQRRWFLLMLLCKENPERATLEKLRVKPTFTTRPWGELIALSQPRPLDPFLIVTGENPKLPPFGDAVALIALYNNLSLTVLGIDPATQPATRVNIVSLEEAWDPIDQTKVINQESWSAPPPDKRDIKGPPQDEKNWYLDYDWGRTLIPYRLLDPIHIKVPEEDRKDGVFFFVYNQRLYVWPKVKMDAGVIQMLRVANLVDPAAGASFEKRGFVPLKETLAKEMTEK